jgi:hypothetical protein
MVRQCFFRTSVLAALAVQAAIAVAQNFPSSQRTGGRSELGISSHLEIAELGLPVVDVAADGPIVAFTVDEFALGHDLNGDGDTDDRVLHVYDSTTGSVFNLGLAAELPQVAGSVVAFKVDERAQGHTDLNGDGDRGDLVEFVYDTTTRTTSNLGLATINVFDSNITARLVPFFAWEAAAETDFNADGDTDDVVAHVYDVQTHTLTNLGVASTPSFGSMNASGPILAIPVDEAAQGNIDLNGDGDASDLVAFAYDADRQVLTNLSIAHSQVPILVSGTSVVVNTPEDVQGFTDLNGDGDTVDYVPFVYDTTTGSLDNLGVAGHLFISGTLGALFASESDQGHTDLNGDGDATDSVLFVFDVATHSLVNLGLAAAPGGFGLSSNLIAWAVPEAGQGSTDLNADGDATDLVIHVYDHSMHSLTNLMLASSRFSVLTLDATAITATDSMAAFAVKEREQGSADLNGDGDVFDNVVHVLDGPSHAVRNLRIALSSVEGAYDLRADGNLLAFRASEDAQGSDLNGDGDMLDRVLNVLDVSTGSLLNTGLALRVEPFVHSTTVVAPVNESAQAATDLDRNGTTDDCCVLHVVSQRQGPPCSAGTVDQRNGAPVPVVRVNGSPDAVSLPTGAPITLSLAASPSGPTSGRYAIWISRAATERDIAVFAPNGLRCGCLVGPSPLDLGQKPQPLFCLIGGVPAGAICGTTHRFSSPLRAPWSITRPTGLARPIALVIQGVLQDDGNSLAPFSVTNRVLLTTK